MTALALFFFAAVLSVWRPVEAMLLLSTLGAAGLILVAMGFLRLGPDQAADLKKLGAALETLPFPSAVSNLKGRVLWKSHSFAEAFPEIGLGDDLSRLAEGNAERAAALFRLFAAAKSHRGAFETIDLGSGRSIVLHCSPLPFGGDRKPHVLWRVGLGGADDDVLHRAPWNRVLQAIPSPAFIAGRNLQVISANAAFTSSFGLSTANATGTTISSRFHDPHGKPVDEKFWKQLEVQASAGKSVQVALATRPKQKALLSAVPLSASQTSPLLCVLQEASAAATEACFTHLFAESQLAAAHISQSGEVRQANEWFLAMSRSTNAKGLNLASLLVDEASAAAFRKCLDQGKDNGAESEAIFVDTAFKAAPATPIRLFLCQAKDRDGFVAIAARFPSPAALDEAALQNQKMQAVGELAGGIAHDFNNLLTAIMGFSDLLLMRFRPADAAFKDVMNIKNNASRAAKLVGQILAYSRRQTLRPTLLSLTDIIEDFNANLGGTLGEKIKLNIQHGLDLWYVKADETQLLQVIMNLAVNARDAMPKGGALTIRTANISERESLDLKDLGLERGEYVMCEVRDTGCGISPEHMRKIFDPFFSTKEVGKGTGLGLSTVYGIVKQTGGSIGVESRVGEGTSFKIYLPRHVETEEELKALKGKAASAGRAMDLTGAARVLLVEDEDAVRSFASRALTTRGYTVLEATSGVEALEIMDREEGKIDLVVSDVVMPEMDGPTLLRHLRERRPDIRVIFMSGYAEEAFRNNLGADEDFIFLPKPFTLKTLAETVKAAAA
jgi:two-component system cell cycle sensor histidine kinase/response regulator CckA